MRRLLAVVLCCLCCVVLLLQGCERTPSKFRSREIVEIALSGERVQIIRGPIIGGQGYAYWCRVSGRTEKAVHGIVSQRTSTVVYPLVRFYEFELREIDE